MNAVYSVTWVESERGGIATIMVTSLNEGSVGTGCKDGGYRALAIGRFCSGDSEQDPEGIFLDKVVGVGYGTLMLGRPGQFEKLVLDSSPHRF